MGGLGIQILFFGLFIITTALFHIRITKNPTARSFSVTGSWQQHIMALYATGALILIRSVFRMIEFGLGYDSVLMKHEAYLLALDGALMFIVAATFVWWHPYKALVGYKDMPKRPWKKGAVDSSGMLPTDTESQSTIPKLPGPYDSDATGVMVPLPPPNSSYASDTQYPFGR